MALTFEWKQTFMIKRPLNVKSGYVRVNNFLFEFVILIETEKFVTFLSLKNNYGTAYLVICKKVNATVIIAFDRYLLNPITHYLI